MNSGAVSCNLCKKLPKYFLLVIFQSCIKRFNCFNFTSLSWKVGAVVFLKSIFVEVTETIKNVCDWGEYVFQTLN